MVKTLDFNSPDDNIYSVTKMLGHRGGLTSYGYYTGTLFAWHPTEKVVPLLAVEGVGVNRLDILADGSVRQLGKELVYYEDLKSREVLDSWHNPYIEKQVEVFQVRNDVMNIHWTREVPAVTLGVHHQTRDRLNDKIDGVERAQSAVVPFRLPWDVFGDVVVVSLDVMLRYPNALPPAEWPEESSGATVNPAEHMTFKLSLTDLQDDALLSAPYSMHLTSLRPWLPWMRMGQRVGHVYHRAQVWKISDLAELPNRFREHIENHDPEYLVPPTTWTPRRAVSTWEQYAHVMTARRKSA